MEKTNKQRPELPKTLLDNLQTEAEDFQNRVLRPLIKMQSDLLMAHLANKLELLKTDLLAFNRDQQIDCLTGLYSKDQSFRREVIGMIIGHLTLSEFESYAHNSKEFNRRITQIVLQRAIDLNVLK
jgi:hypothetical protein